MRRLEDKYNSRLSLPFMAFVIEFWTSGEKGPKSGIVVVGVEASSSWEARRSADPNDLDLLIPGWLRIPIAREGGRKTGTDCGRRHVLCFLIK